MVPRKLMDLIAALPRLGPLVFSEDGVTPDYYLLKDLKRIAAQAGLDPDDCWQHEFRATGATTLLRPGMDLTTVMKMGGWNDVASVQRYLAPLAGAELRDARG